jgi:hypothetical protein
MKSSRLLAYSVVTMQDIILPSFRSMSRASALNSPSKAHRLDSPPVQTPVGVLQIRIQPLSAHIADLNISAGVTYQLYVLLCGVSNQVRLTGPPLNGRYSHPGLNFSHRSGTNSFASGP